MIQTTKSFFEAERIDGGEFFMGSCPFSSYCDSRINPDKKCYNRTYISGKEFAEFISGRNCKCRSSAVISYDRDFNSFADESRGKTLFKIKFAFELTSGNCGLPGY